MNKVADIKINTFYAYQSACRDYMPVISRMENESSVRELYHFVNDANLRIIDWVSGNRKLTDDYVVEMVKKSETLFNQCLTDEQKNDFRKFVGNNEEEVLYKENIKLRHKLEEYKETLSWYEELLEKNGIKINME